MSMETTLSNKILNFYICENFLGELEAVTKKYNNIIVHSYVAKCKYQSISDPFIDKPIDDNSYIVGACTIESSILDQTQYINKEENCFFMLAPKTLVLSYIEQGGYVITPGWIHGWEDYVGKYWAFKKEDATLFFGESCKKLILLDTGISSKSEEKLREFAEFVDRPYEIVSIGLDYFQLYIDRVVIEMNASSKQKIAQAELNKSQKAIADYALTLTLISQLNIKQDESSVIDQIKEIFVMLFAPEEIIYIPIEKGEISPLSSDNCKLKDALTFLDSKDEYKIESDGFSIKLTHNHDIFAIICIKYTREQPYLKQYLNLAINISHLCGLAISNTRKAKKAKELERHLMHQSKLAAMGEMMGSVAHQWRQPLNEININIEMLEEYYDLGEIDQTFIEEYISKNTKIIQFLSKTINNFSDFFRSKKQKADFSLKHCINNTLNLLLARLKKHSISLDIFGEDITIFGLSNELQQVILNIINNAIDVIDQQNRTDGTIKINIESSDNYITLTICDNGGGMEEAIIDRVFEPYFTTKEQGKGIGMGLYISRMIVEKNLDGELTAENYKDGTKFTIKLKYHDR